MLSAFISIAYIQVHFGLDFIKGVNTTKPPSILFALLSSREHKQKTEQMKKSLLVICLGRIYTLHRTAM